MPLDTLSLAELEELLRQEMVRIPGADTSVGSDLWLESKILAAVFHGNQSHAEYLANQIRPSTAEQAFLIKHAADRLLAAQRAAAAAGTLVLRMRNTSVADTTQLVGSKVTAEDGAQYTLSGAATSALPAWVGKTTGTGCTTTRVSVNPDITGMAVGQAIEINGVQRVIKQVHTVVSSIDVYQPFAAAPAAAQAVTALRSAVATVTADAVGRAGNKTTGEVLTIDSPAGVAPNDFLDAVVLELTGGGDDETEASHRGRVRDFVAHRPGAGNLEDYRRWVRETPLVRVAEAFVFPGFRGLGTVDIIPVGEEFVRYLGTAGGVVLTRVTAALAGTIEDSGKAPFVDDYLVRELVYRSPLSNVDVTVEPRSGYEPDWDPSASFTVAGGSTALVVNLGSSPVGVIEVGDRVLVPVVSAGVPSLEQRKAAIVTATSITVDSSLSAAPATGAIVRTGSAVAQPTIDAIRAYYDGLGPGVYDTLTGKTWRRHPDPAVAFDDEVKVNGLVAALMAVEGMFNVFVSVPVTDVRPPPLQTMRLGTLTVRHSTP